MFKSILNTIKEQQSAHILPRKVPLTFNFQYGSMTETHFYQLTKIDKKNKTVDLGITTPEEIRLGDYLLLSVKKSPTRYKIIWLRDSGNPCNHYYSVRAEFSPRSNTNDRRETSAEGVRRGE